MLHVINEEEEREERPFLEWMEILNSWVYQFIICTHLPREVGRQEWCRTQHIDMII